MTPKVIKVSSITVGEFFERHQESLQLKLVGPEVGFDKLIREPAPNRPGLALAGFFSYFAKKRIQVLGYSELSYFKKLESPDDVKRFDQLCKHNIPCLVIARGQTLPDQLSELAAKHEIAIFTSPMVTMKFLNRATILLEEEFAESTSLHGCMVDYRGVGVLIMGKSGSGKSETAIGLLERGAALVADDLVRIRNVGGELITSAPDLARGYIEMRGIGIINAANRLGIRRKGYPILGTSIPHVEIPVAAGRDTARLVSVAALDLQLRRLGYDMADEFNQKLLARMAVSNPTI